MGGVGKNTEQRGRERGRVLVTSSLLRWSIASFIIHFRPTCAFFDRGHRLTSLASGHAYAGVMS